MAENCRYLHSAIEANDDAAAALKLKGKKNKAVPFSFLLFPQTIGSGGNKFILAHANKSGKVLFEALVRQRPGASYAIKKKDTGCVSLDEVVAYLVGGSLKTIKLGDGLPSPTWTRRAAPAFAGMETLDTLDTLGNDFAKKASIRSEKSRAAFKRPASPPTLGPKPALANSYPFQNTAEVGQAGSGGDDPESESDDESVQGFGSPGPGSAPASSPRSSVHGGYVADDVYDVDGGGDADGYQWVPEEMTAFVSFDGSDPDSAATARKIVTTLRPKPFCKVLTSDDADTAASIAATGASIVRSTCMVVVLSQQYLASKGRMSELSLAYTANLPIYCISTVPYDELGHVSFYMRLTLGVVEWLHADAEHYEESVGKLLDAVVHAPEAIKDFNLDGDDDTYGDFGQFRALGDPYSRLYNPTPVPDLNDGGQDWWILKFGSNKAVPIEQLVEAVCTLPLDVVATVPEKLVDTLARAFAPEQLIHKSQVSVVLGLIDPATPVDIDIGFTGTQLLQYLLDRTLLQWHVQTSLGSQGVLRASAIDASKAMELRFFTKIAAALVDQMWNLDSNERLAGILGTCKLYEAKSPPASVVEAFKTLLLDDDFMVRSAAVHACARNGVQDAMPAIVGMWGEDPSAAVRKTCEDCLSKSKDPGVRGMFAARKRLQDELAALQS